MKKTFSILLCLILMLSLGVMAFADNSALMPSGPYSLTIYKYRLDNVDGHSPALSDATGTTADASNVPSDAVPLAGVTFTITLVDSSNIPITGANAYTATGVTNASGMVTFSNIATAGKYHVVETLPAGATSAALDFYVDLPMTKVTGDGWITNVVLYPKNELVQGAVILTKTGEDGTTGLENAVFKLQKRSGDAGSYTWADYTAAGASFTTDANGKLAVNNLPSGHYAFVETAAPSGYAVDSTPIEFDITASGSVDASYAETGTVVKVSRSNSNLPDIDKSINLNDPATLKVGDDVQFTITSTLPTDLSSYTEYYITDTLTSAQLTYKANSIKVYGVPATGDATLLTATTDYDFTNTPGSGTETLVVKFIDKDNSEGVDHYSSISAYKSIKIEFLATIVSLDTTVTNTATLDYNNDHGADGQKTTTPDPTDPTDPVLNKGSLTITKVAADEPTHKLAGAKFSIYPTEADANASTNALAINTPTDANGVLTINDLVISGTSRTFWLVETQAPTGYKLMTAPVSVTVSKNASDAYVGVATIENTASSIITPDGNINLPKTGGIGTTIFTVLGLALIGGGAAAISKTRKKNGGKA